MQLRDAGPADLSDLVAALLDAVNWSGRERVTREQALADPSLAHYVTGWPRPGDFGTIAGEDPGGPAIGAAWCRLFAPADPGYGFVAADVPEFSIGVAPGHRGRGVGTALLGAVLDQARARGLRAVSLSVEDGNRARTLYERAGFVPVGRAAGSATMLRPL